MLAYFDTYSGASGDMILGALLDAGLDIDQLRCGLAALPLDGYLLSRVPVMKGAIGATSFHVHNSRRESTGQTVQTRADEDTHDQPHRHLGDILALIASSTLPPGVQRQASDIFTTLGHAEARVHRVSIEDVHFHEVGAVDAIVDIVGTCLALHLLGITEVYCSPLPGAGVGGGPGRKVAHGWIPIPGPATLEIIAAAGAPIVAAPQGSRAELLTPTGAAILCTLASFRQPPMILRRVGYGAGDADLEYPNVLRVWLGDPCASLPSVEGSSRHTTPDSPQSPPGEAMPPHDLGRDEQKPGLDVPDHDLASQPETVLLQTNIDDMNPQVYGYLFDRFLAAHALDVWCTPIIMKKNRPATMLSVLCHSADMARFADLLLRETTTLGIRVQSLDRVIADRVLTTVETPLGAISVKVKSLTGRVVSATPEYEDCAILARRHNRPLVDVLALAQRAALNLIDAGGGVIDPDNTVEAATHTGAMEGSTA